MINLFTSYYSCGDEARQREIDQCLMQNVENVCVDRIVVFIDDGSTLPVHDSKLEVVHLDKRPTYRDWVLYNAKLNLKGVSILANSDIYFDETVVHLSTIVAAKKSFVALSRWEVSDIAPTLHPNPHWSQDAWAIDSRTTVSESMSKTIDFPMGVPRCDNKISYVFAINGWKVFNPCFDVKSFHVHATGLRSYSKKFDDRIIGGVAYVHPSKSVLDPALLDLDVWVLDSTHLNEPQLNKSLEKWRMEASLEATEPAPALTVPDKHATKRLESKPEPLDILINGERITRRPLGYEVWKNGEHLFARHGFGLGGRNHFTPLALKADWNDNQHDVHLIPNVIETHIEELADRPRSSKDINFWQYPCLTEKQALDNHRLLPAGANIDFDRRCVSTYLALPWATYIDKKCFPDRFLASVALNIRVLKDLAAKSGFNLSVHTVCQHIRWEKILKICDDLGVTNLHLSHNETGAQSRVQAARLGLELESWPLIAPNLENEDRREGITIGKNSKSKQYTASFIGAHMPHYRSEVRKELAQLAEHDGGEDLFVKVNHEWHFNKVVYDQQIANKTPESHASNQSNQELVLYNQVLSNSVFSLCPEGAGPNTLRLWESLGVGSIPVIISDNWKHPEIYESLHFSEFTLKWDSQDLRGIFEFLRSIHEDKILMMQKKAMKAYANFKWLVTYGHEYAFSEKISDTRQI